MDKENYKNAIGCIVSYKSFYESLLFNELNEKCVGLKLEHRGVSTSAFITSDYTSIISEIHKDGFIFLQHIHPFMYKSEISGRISDFTTFTNMMEKIIFLISSDDKLTCQCRIDSKCIMEYSNVDLTNLLVSFLEEKGYHLYPQEADTVISLTVYKDFAYIGISNLEDNISDWTGGVLFYSKKDDIICRAEFKIEEAFKVFRIKTNEGMMALDLGAAPGGWTHYLSRQGVHVDAVDPANLNQSVLCRSNVKHYKMTAQQFAESNLVKRYDIMVNDMKMDTNQSIDIICEMSNQLKKDGICLMTLKLPKNDVKKRINTAKKVLSKKFEIIKIRQLYYNRSEVTIFAKNRL